MAMAGSEQDDFLLWDLVKWRNDKLTIARHPADPKWSDPALTSRDQLLCFAAGVYRTKKLSTFLPRQACLDQANSWMINKDILLPHNKLALYRAARVKVPLFVTVVSYPFMLLHMAYNAFITPKSEQNQTIAMLSTLPHWWLRTFCKWHPDIVKNLKDYWGGYPWRDQNEIAEAIINFLKVEGYLE